jgi:hypothetical protein
MAMGWPAWTKPAGIAGDFRFKGCRVHLALRTVDGNKPRAVAEEFRRAALIGDDVRFPVAE